MSHPAAAPLSEAYLNPTAYLRNEKFHRTLTFTPSPSASPSSPPLTVSYSLCGSVSSTAPCLVWLNGMGHHRQANVLFDGICADKGVRLLTIDRPGRGKSTLCPLTDRTRVAHESLLHVLEKEGITEISLLSHSNGLIYSLYTLLHFPSPPSSSSAASSSSLRVKSWHLSSPYVPPWHSSSLPLSIARYIPAPLTAQLGSVATFAQKTIEPFVASTTWSAGVAGAVKAWGAAAVSPGTSTTTTATTRIDEAEEPLTPTEEAARKQRARFVELDAKKPRHKQMFGGLYYGPQLFAKSMKMIQEEGSEGMGQEALICLRQGEGREWRWLEGIEDGGEEEVPEGEMFERAFGALKEKWGREGEAPRMSVVYGTEDILVPAKGRRFLHELLVGKLKMVEEDKWVEVEEAEHDDPLGLTCVMEPLLDEVLAIHATRQE